MQRKKWVSKQYKPRGTPGKRRGLDEMTFSELVQLLDIEHSFNLRAGTAARQGHSFVKCYTCGKMDHWKSMHCGHFIGRKWYGVRWDERNTRIQCYNCNCNNEGEKVKFALNLTAEGIDIASLQEIADYWGQTHVGTDVMIERIKEYRSRNATIRKNLLGL